MSIDVEIAGLTERRAEIWAGDTSDDVGELPRIAARLEVLYAERRAARAQTAVGGMTPEEIRRRAKIDEQIERLMTQAG